MRRLVLSADTIGPVARGHPWVYREAVRGGAAIGELVQLVDGRDRPVAIGIFDEGPIAVRVLGTTALPLPELIRARVAAAIDRRRLVGPDTDAYRVLNGEGDALPGVVVDRYGDLAVLRLYSKAWEKHLGLIVDALPFPQVYRRFGVERVDGREGGEPLRGGQPADVVIVREHGMKLLVRPKVGQKTGMFLDQREHRRMVRGWAAGRTVLNLFSYTGGFSVAAALGGAKRVVSVDIAAPALEDAKEIFRLNGLDPAAHGFEATDAFEYGGPGADLVVVDPPSLTHASKADASARSAYKKLHRAVGPKAKQLLATSSCTARLSWDRWEEAIRESLGAGWAMLHRSGEPVDHPVLLNHPEGRYLKFALLGRVER